MNPAETLRIAAQHVRHAGWCQHRLRNEAGEICAMEAIRITSGLQTMTAYRSDVAGVVKRALGLPDTASPVWCDPGSAVARWNNTKGQTAENVALGLEYAAMYWEQEQAARLLTPEVLAT